MRPRYSRKMKRPVPIYFVAAWCFFALMMLKLTLSGWLAAKFSDKSQSAELAEILSVIGFILIIWHLFCLIQLKSFNRWFSIVIFGCWIWFCSWRVYVCFHIVENPLRPLLAYSIFDAISIACIWYLGRKTFRDFAVQFVSERENEKKFSARLAQLLRANGR